ncbi:MAG: HD family phosphohydrolase [Bacteroidota bacterium]
MSRLINFIRDKHSLWYKFLLYFFSVAAIVVLMPGESSFRYDSARLEGNPWQYEDLNAPFDFPIYKSAGEINQEKKEILTNRKFYFSRSKSFLNVEERDGFLGRIKYDHQKLAKEVLDTIFKTGIIETSEITLNKKSDFIVYILENNEEKEFKLGEFFTISSANKFIEERLSVLPANESQMLHDSLLNYFAVSVFYNKEFSDKVLNQSLSSILPSRGMIKKGQSIINNGEIVTSEKVKILNSFRRDLNQGSENGKRESRYLLIGHTITVGISLAVMMCFLYFFRPTIFSKNSEITFIFLLIILINLIACRVSVVSKEYIYFIPFSLIPIVVRTFFDTRTALFTHLNAVIIGSFFSSDGFSFMIVELFAGIAAIFSVASLSRRSQLLSSMMAVLITGLLAQLAIRLIIETSTFSFNMSDILPFTIGSAAVLLAYPLIYISEKSFGFISDFTLLELSGSNSELMRELAVKSPGTFQHSLQVANLAEEAIFKIGGNALLVRAGALYHDIGKISNPRFFIENRMGNGNPHDELPYEESAKIIIQHVIDGIELAKKYKLPDQIIDFIRTHHGTTATRYFLKHYQSVHPGEVIDERLFRYPGPIPFSKETAVLMMADSVEAASRSIKNYDAQSIDQLVDSIIDSQIAENQFLNSDITFKDINSIKKIFKRRLMNIYHVRIEYPR